MVAASSQQTQLLFSNKVHSNQTLTKFNSTVKFIFNYNFYSTKKSEKSFITFIAEFTPQHHFPKNFVRQAKLFAILLFGFVFWCKISLQQKL